MAASSRTYPVEVMPGSEIVEVRQQGVHKGMVVPAILKRTQSGAATFIVAIGDDRTDEDLFAALPEQSCAIKVGPGPTQARFRLEVQPEVRALLESLL